MPGFVANEVAARSLRRRGESQWKQIDTVESEVAVHGNNLARSHIRVNGKPYETGSNLPPGPYTSGGFGEDLKALLDPNCANKFELAGREEAYFSTSANGANYSATPTDLGYSGAWPITVGNGYYQVSVCTVALGGAACAPSTLGGPAYTITATPVAGTSQAADSQCTSFAVDSVGQQYATGSQTAQYCWGN